MLSSGRRAGGDVAVKAARGTRRVSPLLNLHGRPDHSGHARAPFWVEQGLVVGGSCKSATCADDEKPTRAGRRLADSGEVKTVYNFHVADYHTYYVGVNTGLVWTHNSSGHVYEVGTANNLQTPLSRDASQPRPAITRGRTARRQLESEEQGGQRAGNPAPHFRARGRHGSAGGPDHAGQRS